jgi:hypothetical protein
LLVLAVLSDAKAGGQLLYRYLQGDVDGYVVNIVGDSFTCTSGLTISANKVCDLINDCGDGSDEIHPYPCVARCQAEEQTYHTVCALLTFAVLTIIALGRNRGVFNDPFVNVAAHKWIQMVLPTKSNTDFYHCFIGVPFMLLLAMHSAAALTCMGGNQKTWTGGVLFFMIALLSFWVMTVTAAVATSVFGPTPAQIFNGETYPHRVGIRTHVIEISGKATRRVPPIQSRPLQCLGVMLMVVYGGFSVPGVFLHHPPAKLREEYKSWRSSAHEAVHSTANNTDNNDNSNLDDNNDNDDNTIDNNGIVTLVSSSTDELYWQLPPGEVGAHVDLDMHEPVGLASVGLVALDGVAGAAKVVTVRVQACHSTDREDSADREDSTDSEDSADSEDSPDKAGGAGNGDVGRLVCSTVATGPIRPLLPLGVEEAVPWNERMKAWMGSMLPGVEAMPTKQPPVHRFDAAEFKKHHFDLSEYTGLVRWLRISLSVPASAGVVGLRSVVIHRTLARTPTAQLPWYSTPIWLSLTRAFSRLSVDEELFREAWHDRAQGYSFEPTLVYLAVCTGGFAFCGAVYLYLQWGCVCNASCLDNCPPLGEPCRNTCKCQCQTCECPCRCDSRCRSRCSKGCVAECRCQCLFCKCPNSDTKRD